MVELVDTGDLKSPSPSGVRVRAPLRALALARVVPQLLALVGLGACAADDAGSVRVVPREAGVRGPLSAPCDLTDDTRCALPWPSNTFTVADASTATGLRVAVTTEATPVDDDLTFMNLADGFSRATGVVFGFEVPVDLAAADWNPASSLSADSPLQVINIQSGHPLEGQRMAYRSEWRDLSTPRDSRYLLVGRPVQVLAPDADHVAVVLSSVGSAERPREVEVALGLTPPTTDYEALRAGYFAPVVDALTRSGVDLESVVRLTEFTTRSAADPTHRMHHMMDVLDQGVEDLDVEIESVSVAPSAGVAAIVRGKLTGAPSFLQEDGHLALDSRGLPRVVGLTDITFRLSIPAAEGDYRIALFGHGTGGDVTDPSFDDELGQEGIGKLSLRFDGWTGDDFVFTLVNFATFLEGSARSTAGLMQALAGGTVLLTALDGVLGETMAGETLLGEPNPAAGRYPLTDDVAWLGGSMGGTMGAVVVSADPRLQTAVLNVPGAGWTHMVPYSLLYESGMESIMLEVYNDPLDLQVAMVMAQNNWDDVDGAVWGDEALEAGGTFLLQQVMDDPILPNLGTELLANALQAGQLSPSLQSVVGLQPVEGVVTSGAALTQFRVPEEGQYDVHGFAGRDTLAADAALEQILHLLLTTWAGAPEIIHPTICSEVGSDDRCDFSTAW